MSYRIFLHSPEEVEIFKDFIIRNNGDLGILKDGFLKPCQLYEVSVDLKCHYLHLVGYVSHMAYPASTVYQHNLDGFIFWYENNYLGFKDVEIIKHIPHSSTDFPAGYEHHALHFMFGGDYKIQNYKLSDLFVDTLFSDIKGIEVKAKYSRLYCDVERYKDNEKEPMAKLGQGYIYEKNIFNGRSYVRKLNYCGNKLWDGIDSYYDEHHKRLTDETKKILENGKKVLILDLHSFSDEQAELIGKVGPFPDICIGLNDTKYDQRILNVIIKKIKDKGYSYQINYPYSGSIIPNNLTESQMKNVSSIMIEVNKRLYL